MWKDIIHLWKSDNLLQRAWDKSFEMMDIAQEMFREAVRSLRGPEPSEVNKEIRQKDKIVNEYEQDVRRMVMTHCTLQGPTELPAGMILVSIVIDIERIGDYVKNMLDLAALYPKRVTAKGLEETLTEIDHEVSTRFSKTIDILKNDDVDSARELMATFKEEISLICDDIVDSAIQGKIEGITPSDSAALALYARYMKRVSAHLNNMVTSVVNPFERIGFRELDES